MEELPTVLHAALVRAGALRRRETKRQLAALPADVWNYPTTSRPGDDYRALFEPIVTRERRSRRLQQWPALLSVEPQAPTPAVYPALVRMEAIRRRETRRCLRRPLVVPEHFALLPVGDTYPSYLAQEAHRRHGWRHPLRVAELNVYPQTPAAGNAPFVATQSQSAVRRAARQGLFLAASEAVEARVTAQYPSYVPSGFFRRHALDRRLLRTTTPRFEPTPPVPEQPLTAWLAPCVNRRHSIALLRTVAPLDEYPATPAVPEQPLSAWAEREPFKRDGWRVRRDLPGLDRYPHTPGQSEAAFPGWIPPRAYRRCGWRTLRAVERVPEVVQLAAGHQPYSAWLAHEVGRRKAARWAMAQAGIADYAEPQSVIYGVPGDQRIGVPARSRAIDVVTRSTTITVN